MRHTIRYWLLVWLTGGCLNGWCALPEPTAVRAYTAAVKRLTDVMVTDVVGPCGAARYYAYAQLAAYEVIARRQHPVSYVAFSGLLNGYPAADTVPPDSLVDVEFGCVYALLRTGEAMLPSGYILEAPLRQLQRGMVATRGLSAAQLQATQAFADRIVQQIVAYAAADGYVNTSGYPRYTPNPAPGFWRPTPPAYAEAYESHWASLRPFLLDSVAQFRPARPVPYAEAPGSPFWQLASEVYETGRQLSPEQRHIADFWDCNPFFLNQRGHMSFGTKKISPAGHWMGITGLVCQQQQLSLAETVRWHTFVALTVSDALSSCWEEKYTSQRVRPETYINRFIDPRWRPHLQTPPFPEYTSGHSVLSTAVAVVLTRLAGEVAYTDTVEEEFGVPARSFQSFRQAATEAAMSRLYGGIHFRDSVEQGAKQGEAIGQFVLHKLGL